jgi:hypothetical protein
VGLSAVSDGASFHAGAGNRKEPSSTAFLLTVLLIFFPFNNTANVRTGTTEGEARGVRNALTTMLLAATPRNRGSNHIRDIRFILLHTVQIDFGGLHNLL